MAMDLQAYASQIAGRAREASDHTAELAADVKNAAMRLAADRLESRADLLARGNALDLEAGRDKGLAPPLLERLTLTPARIASMAEGLRDVAALPDPVDTSRNRFGRR